METIGFYAGSFDPFTNGHMQIVKKASKCFSKIIIGIAKNSEKVIRIDKEKMKEAIEKTIREQNLENVYVVLYDGLTVAEAQKQGATILIRGLRNGTDYQYEETIVIKSSSPKLAEWVKRLKAHKAEQLEKLRNVEKCDFEFQF